MIIQMQAEALRRARTTALRIGGGVARPCSSSSTTAEDACHVACHVALSAQARSCGATRRNGLGRTLGTNLGKSTRALSVPTACSSKN